MLGRRCLASFSVSAYFSGVNELLVSGRVHHRGSSGPGGRQRLVGPFRSFRSPFHFGSESINGGTKAARQSGGDGMSCLQITPYLEDGLPGLGYVVYNHG